MFLGKVDIGNLDDAAERYERAYQDSIQAMKARLDAAAAEERSTHRYQNRTGDLEAGTRAGEVLSTGDVDVVQLTADTPYAVYVNTRGFMRIDELAAGAESDIGAIFEALPSAI